MVDIAHQLVMIADSTSETWWELVDDASGGREVIYRSEIHAVLVEISHMCDFGAFGAPGAHGRESGGVGCTYAPTRTRLMPPGTWAARLVSGGH